MRRSICTNDCVLTRLVRLTDGFGVYYAAILGR
uniref:Uncharacterized protein n=1 Tax=Timema bartmani TaxID=61472 RepID=A0A7R9EYL2_9NEOP|nr:unnamed protein product [Timema bartmani]